MFESAELIHEVDKGTYEERVPGLRHALLDAQYRLLEDPRFSVVILLSGVDGGGKGDTLNLLNEWMDPRHVHTKAFGVPTEEERDRPIMWRYWRILPPRGKTVIVLGGWYDELIVQLAHGQIDKQQFDAAMARIRRFERMLGNEDVLLLKFWMHLSKAQQKARFKDLEQSAATRWRVTADDWAHHAQYGKLRRAAERALRDTSTAEAPWTVVAGAEPRYRHLTVGEQILHGMEFRFQSATIEPAPIAPRMIPAEGTNLLKALDLTAALSKKAYAKRLAAAQGRLNRLSRRKKFKDLSVVLVFEGPDAAGKGGAIRRVTHALDARVYEVFPIAAPSDEERSRPYLWRFWRNVPPLGKVAIFDRSWYGRVLVERVEGFAPPQEWSRAYEEINDFEEQLVEAGAVVVKFWLALSPEEQAKRFEARAKIAYKRFKLTSDDLRNRAKWDDYETAACEMIDRTSTDTVPWTLVEAENKYFARIKVLETLCERIEARLKVL